MKHPAKHHMVSLILRAVRALVFYISVIGVLIVGVTHVTAQYVEWARENLVHLIINAGPGSEAMIVVHPKISAFIIGALVVAVIGWAAWPAVTPKPKRL